jgi:two-component system, cell cycle response regulator
MQEVKGKTILVVDDSSTMRTLIARELEEAGYTVLTAENGMEAVSMIEWMDEKPDLVTLDLDMPVMNGFEVCEYLRDKPKKQGEQQAGFPIVFIAANDTLENRRHGFQLGVTHFIAKPFKPHDIVHTVNKLLSPRRDFAGMTALVIDDSSSVRRVMQMILMRIGVTVLTAANGLEAITVIESCNCPLDIIITDYMMPEMRGDELC